MSGRYSQASLTILATFSLVGLAARAAPPPDAVALEVPGRSSGTPWIASSGSFVAVAWGASLGGKTDVFVAVSRNGGVTFGSPVQVNRVPGEARLSGELPPRVAVASKSPSSAPEMVVLWTASGGTTAIKTARSRDGGRTFDLPITLQSAGAPGDRGWPAVALDHQGTAHALRHSAKSSRLHRMVRRCTPSWRPPRKDSWRSGPVAALHRG